MEAGGGREGSKWKMGVYSSLAVAEGADSLQRIFLYTIIYLAISCMDAEVCSCYDMWLATLRVSGEASLGSMCWERR